MRVALLHDWLIHPGGAEQVLAAIHSLFPGPLYTLMCKGPWPYQTHTSPLQPTPTPLYRTLLPLYFAAAKTLRPDHDLILSSSHAAIKAVPKHPHQIHICYCHTPMRYIWDLAPHYFRRFSTLAHPLLSYLRTQDRASAANVDHFIANSHTVAARIQKHYNRTATVIYPPVDWTHLPFSPKKSPYYLAFSRHVSYKRLDIIVDAFASLPHRQLLVMGTGPQLPFLRRRAPSNVHFLGYQRDKGPILSNARALLFAAEEDFGIIPVEAQCCGTPVIAYRKGGATETILDGTTGLFFDQQTPASLLAAIKTFEENERLFDPERIREHARAFSAERFARQYQDFVLKHAYENPSPSGRPR